MGNIEKPHQSAGATQRQRLVPELIFWAPQTEVRVEISSMTFHCQLILKKVKKMFIECFKQTLQLSKLDFPLKTLPCRLSLE